MSRRSIRRDVVGATAVEFALVAPVFLMMLLMIMEGSRMLWMQQSLNEVAYSSVRCMGFGSACSTNSQVQSYAVARAATYNIALTTANVTATGNTTCNGNTGAQTVRITASFGSPLAGLIPSVPTSLTGSACFATL